MRPLKWLRKLSRNERGNAIIVCAGTLPLVIGAAAIGVDTVQVSLAKRQLQRTADSAAIAGAYARHAALNVTSAVNYDLGLNNDVPRNSTVIETPPTAGPFSGNNRAVRVILTANRAVPFFRFFRRQDMTVSVEATATAVVQGRYCMVALEDGNVTGIDMGGSSVVNLGCGMISNSTSPNAIVATGNASVAASPVAAVGGVPSSNNYEPGTVRMPYTSPQPDPLASLPMPAVPTGCGPELEVGNGNTLTIDPANTTFPGRISAGVYCFAGMDIKGTLTLPPDSVIMINGSTLDFAAQAHVTGTRVTFLLTSSTAATDPSSIAQLNLNAGVELDITPPTSGPYANVVMYQDRRAPLGDSHINGNSDSTLSGAFYFPRRRLIFNGTAGMQTNCINLVGRTLAFSGDSEIVNSCPPTGGPPGFEATFVRLVR